MPVIFMEGSPLNSVGNVYNTLHADAERLRQEREDTRRFDLEHARRVESDLYDREADERNFERGVFESNRGFRANERDRLMAEQRDERNYERGVLESDRNYGLAEDREERIGEQSDQALGLQVMREERYAQGARQPGSRRPRKMDGASILDGLGVLRQYDPQAARDLEYAIQKRTGKLGIQRGDFDDDDLFRLNTYGRVWNQAEAALGRAAQQVNSQAQAAGDQLVAQAFGGLKTERAQQNLAERVAKLKQVYSTNVLHPEDAAKGAQAYERALQAAVAEEQRREMHYFEAEKMIAEGKVGMDPNEAANLKNSILFEEGHPDKAMMDFRAYVVPEEGSQRQLGLREGAAAAAIEAGFSGNMDKGTVIHDALGGSDPRTRGGLGAEQKMFPDWLDKQDGMSVERFNELPREEQNEVVEQYKAQRNEVMSARDIRMMKEMLDDPTIPQYQRDEYRRKLIEAGEIDR